MELDEIGPEVSPPTGVVTMVVADIGKWELLWEDNTVPMTKVMYIYCATLRKEMRRREGYEVSMEGRICRVVFRNPKSALEWCLRVQLELLQLDWPKELLSKPYCSPVETGGRLVRRGLLVAMGISTGVPNITLNHVSNRPEYTGSMVIKTASICKLAQYGQVLVGDSTMKVVAPQLNTLADLKPKAVRLGEFTFTGFKGSEKITQILPGVLVARNFGNMDVPSKPHLVRGVSDFQRSSLSNLSTAARTTSDPTANRMSSNSIDLKVSVLSHGEKKTTGKSGATVLFRGDDDELGSGSVDTTPIPTPIAVSRKKKKKDRDFDFSEAFHRKTKKASSKDKGKEKETIPEGVELTPHTNGRQISQLPPKNGPPSTGAAHAVTARFGDGASSDYYTSPEEEIEVVVI